MKGDPLPDDHHVVRYVKPSLIDDGVVDGGAFELKYGHDGISVNWLEAFEGKKETQLAEIRRLKRLDWSRNGALAEINIGDIKRRLVGEIPDISIIEDPLDSDEKYKLADPSHSLICGLPYGPPELLQALQDEIALGVLNIYPAIS